MARTATNARTRRETKAPRAPRGGTSKRTRLSPEARQRQLLDVAARVLSEDGAPALEITTVAARAGVTRPVVYRFFPTRTALLVGVLEDFESDLVHRYQQALLRTLGAPLERTVVAFVEASCDAIEAKGKGAWNLLDARDPDLEAARLGRKVQSRMIAPFVERLAEVTGRSPIDVETVARIVVAAGRAGLDGYLEGRIPRQAAVRDAARAVGAVIAAFATDVPTLGDVLGATSSKGSEKEPSMVAGESQDVRTKRKVTARTRA
ncbi:MAG: TetR/AcrR family transcriptional regulator [Polyangiales bacterium]